MMMHAIRHVIDAAGRASVQILERGEVDGQEQAILQARSPGM
jgi:hypothetical protein